MSQPAQGVQPSVLQWARETAGLSHEEVANKLKRDPSDILDWEAGTGAPTYPQLERLAYEVYKRPLAMFFLPAPPAERSPAAEFRTLPADEQESLSADTRYQVRLAKAFQLSLEELHEGRNPVANPIFRAITLTTQSDVAASAAAIRERLGFSTQDQRATRSVEEALKAWRRAVEEAGVYVFKHSFKQKRISGFCLQHEQFPVIYLNNGNKKTRQAFSLMHELAHLLLRVNGISSLDEVTFGGYSPEQKRIEIFCNRIAAEVLFPGDAFDAEIAAARDTSDPWIAQIATRYRISREVVLRRLLDRGLITREEYLEKSRAWANAAEGGGSGGNYYATNASYLGDKYLRLVFGKHYKGQLSIEQVADYLGVKTGSVSGLETMVLAGRAD